MAQTYLQPYAAVHADPKGPGDARPTALDIIKDERLTGRWQDKTVLITGGASGIGVETARALHHTGAQVYITTRNVAKAERVRKEILATSPSKTPIGIITMELDSLASVKAGAEAFLQQSSQLNILINNAGVMACPKGKTADGFETHMGTNHFSHFLFTQLLLPTLVSSATPNFPSRVVNLASTGQWYQDGGLGAPGVFEDLAFDEAEYDAMTAYGRSKHANVLHANGIETKYGSDHDHPVHAFSLHPGGITTELWRHLDTQGSVSGQTEEAFKSIWKNAEQGAATTVWCATAAAWNGKAGKYCENCGESEPSEAKGKSDWVRGASGYPPWSYDRDAEARLWTVSEEAVRMFMQSR